MSLKFFFFNLGFTRSLLLHTGFSSCNEQGLLFFVCAYHFGSFSCWRAQALGVRTSITEVSATQAQSLQCAALGCPGFTSCHTQGQSLQLMGYSIDSVVVCMGLVLWHAGSPQTRDQTCLCLLHWQADSYLLCHQWSPPLLLYACVSVWVCIVVQLLSYIWLSATPWTVTLQASLSFTHVHWVGDTIQLSHPLLSPSPPGFSLSQHQGLFQWVGSLDQVAKI